MTAPAITDLSTAMSDVIASSVAAMDANEAAQASADTSEAPDTALVDNVVADATDDATDAPVDADTADEADGEAGADDPALPDGYVAVPTVTDGLATDFVLKDADGEVEVPDLIVEYKANGKVRQDRLDQVVKLAQWGVYQQDKFQQMEQTMADVQQQEQALRQLVAEREAQMERLLTDPEFLLSVQDAFEAENSPERRAQRAEERFTSLQVQQQMQHIEGAWNQFADTEVLPAVDMIVNALPTVTQQELEERIAMVMQAHGEVAPNGQMHFPPSRYDTIRQYIVNDLALWAQAAHARRAQPAETPAQRKAQAELEKARVDAQKAKRQIGHITKPVGRSDMGSASRKPAKPVTLDDAMSSVMDTVLASAMG
jgi:hypothetical protein